MSPGPDAPPDPLIGLSIGNYAITARIGAGGMGAVYLAQHPDIGRKVAVKVLLPEHSQRQDLITRFFNEAKTAATLRHPALVEVFDYGFLPDGAGYLVMDFLEGESLAARLGRVAPLAPEAAAEIARQLSAGVAAAHGQGIVHRDLKPDNIFLVPDPELPEGERVKILDFGIAKLMFGSGGGSKGATSTGMLMGTPLYMAPEQCRGAGQVDHRADVYSTGCILYEMLSGRPPFDYEGVGEILAAHLHQPPRPLAEIDPSLPVPLVDIVMRALAKDPGVRQQTMAALGAELQTFLRGGRLSEAHPRLSSGLATPSATRNSTARAQADAGRVRTSAVPDAASPGVGTGARAPSGIATAPTTFSAAAGETAPPPAPAPPAPARRIGLFIVPLALVALGAAGVVLWPRLRPAVPFNKDPGGAGAGQPKIIAKEPAKTAGEPAKTDDPTKTGAENPAVAEPAEPAKSEDPATAEPAKSEDPATAEPVAAAAETIAPAESDVPDAAVVVRDAAVARPGAVTSAPARIRTRAVTPADAPELRQQTRAMALAAQAFEHRLKGDDAAALQAYRQALRVGGLPAAERAEVDQRIVDLQRKFGEIEIYSSIAGARVTIDGRDHGATPLRDPILVRPGTHQVTLSLPGHQPNRRSVSVGAGKKEIVQLRWSR